MIWLFQPPQVESPIQANSVKLGMGQELSGSREPMTLTLMFLPLMTIVFQCGSNPTRLPIRREATNILLIKKTLPQLVIPSMPTLQAISASVSMTTPPGTRILRAAPPQTITTPLGTTSPPSETSLSTKPESISTQFLKTAIQIPPPPPWPTLFLFI